MEVLTSKTSMDRRSIIDPLRGLLEQEGERGDSLFSERPEKCNKQRQGRGESLTQLDSSKQSTSHTVDSHNGGSMIAPIISGDNNGAAARMSHNKLHGNPNADHSGLSANSGLGFNVNLWDPSAIRKTSKSLEDLFGDDIHTNKDGFNEGGLFGEVTFPSPVNAAPPSGRTIGSKLRVLAEEDDDNIDGLAVSRLLQREENLDLDFEIFGKAAPARREISSKLVNSSHAVKNRDELDLSGLDEIASMERAILSTTSRVASVSVASSTVAEPLAVVDLDGASFDLNAYISQQGNSGGGLFD